jgi:large subunit ribosomal protein L21
MGYVMYALVDYIGNQILIKEGEKVKIPFLDKKVGSKVSFDNILFFDDGKNKKIGSPYIKSLSFSGKIDSHNKENKVIVFKKKRRKGHQKKNGHTQKFTLVTMDKFSKVVKAKKTITKKKSSAKSKTTAK